MAVGTGFAQNEFHTLAEVWKGKSWNLVPSPNPSASNNFLNGVDCLSTNFCFAVGATVSPTQGGHVSLIEEWDGNKWSVVTSPNVNPATEGNYLNSISCASIKFCVAVGEHQANDASAQGVLVEQWNGRTWQTASAPNPSDTSQFLGGVSCISETFCIAAGDYSLGPVTNFVTQTLIEQWNGTDWTTQASPSPNSMHFNGLYSVSCGSSTTCLAVGWYTPDGQSAFGLVETWQSGVWSLSDVNGVTPNGAVLFGVTCPTSTACSAAGYTNNGVANQTLILDWQQGVWSAAQTPNTSASQDNGLNGIDCPKVRFCFAVGSSFDGVTAHTLALKK
jgi:hypothetical protein